jgi:phage shock protein C
MSDRDPDARDRRRPERWKAKAEFKAELKLKKAAAKAEYYANRARAWNTESYTGSPNPKRLYKNPMNKVAAGVFAGIADYFGWDVVWVRVGALIGLFTPLNGVIVIGYIIAAIVLPRRPFGMPVRLDEEDDQFWRSADRKPAVLFGNLKYKFQDLEDRLAGMERVVTTEEWGLRRQFRDLETPKP